MPRLKTLALAPAILFALPQAVAAAPAPLAQVQAHLQAVDTMTANFTQTDRNGQVPERHADPEAAGPDPLRISGRSRC